MNFALMNLLFSNSDDKVEANRVKDAKVVHPNVYQSKVSQLTEL